MVEYNNIIVSSKWISKISDERIMIDISDEMIKCVQLRHMYITPLAYVTQVRSSSLLRTFAWLLNAFEKCDEISGEKQTTCIIII